MANLPEDSGYPEGITRLETTMSGKGGPVVYDQAGNLVDGFLNAPLQQLAARTAWLKDNMGSGASAVVYFSPNNESGLTNEHIGKFIVLTPSESSDVSSVYLESGIGKSGDEIHLMTTSGNTQVEVLEDSLLLVAEGFAPALRASNSIATLKKIYDDPEGDVWLLFGDLATEEEGTPGLDCWVSSEFTYYGDITNPQAGGGITLEEGEWGPNIGWNISGNVYFAYDAQDSSRNYGTWNSPVIEHLRELIIYESDGGLSIGTRWYEAFPYMGNWIFVFLGTGQGLSFSIAGYAWDTLNNQNTGMGSNFESMPVQACISIEIAGAV